MFPVLFYLAFTVHAQENPDPNRFLPEIEAFRTWDQKNSLPEKFVLLIGSSSMRMWPSAATFLGRSVVNRGFGGAHISDVLHFTEDVLINYPEPLCIVFFCGSNDIADGKDAERVVEDFQKFRAVAASRAPGTPLVYIPINPCPQRWHLWKEADRANRMIRRFCGADTNLYYADTAGRMLETGQPPADSLFLEDKLHLSDKGYALWTSVIRPVVERAIHNRPDRVRSTGVAELYGMDLGNFIAGEKYQYSERQLDGSAYWLPDSTFKAVLEATWKQLRRAGFRIVVAHGHGPSTQFVRDHADEWREQFGLQFLTCRGSDDAQGLGIMVDHAAMNETSLVMALRPELVHMETLPADTSQWPVGVGGRDPRLHATPELGRRALQLQKERMKAVLKEALDKFEADSAEGKR